MPGNLIVDSMHAGDQGCFADAIGGVFWCEVTCKRWHANQRSGLVSLNGMLQSFYSANRSLGLSSLFPVTMSQIRGDRDRFPTLHAKAAQSFIIRKPLGAVACTSAAGPARSEVATRKRRWLM
jgi:hypothetical protein